jgi:hypothetical protein
MNERKPAGTGSSFSNPKRKAMHLRAVDPGEIHATDQCCYCGARERWLDPDTWNWLGSFIHIATRAPALRCSDYLACIRRRKERTA